MVLVERMALKLTGARRWAEKTVRVCAGMARTHIWHTHHDRRVRRAQILFDASSRRLRAYRAGNASI